jgi:hypothetical protein
MEMDSKSPANQSPQVASPRLMAPRRGLSREEAARYVGVSPSKFDEMRKDGRIGPPKLIDARKVWDIYQLDEAFDALPSERTHSDQQNDEWTPQL